MMIAMKIAEVFWVLVGIYMLYWTYTLVKEEEDND